MNTPIKPLDPDSPRGRELVGPLSEALADVAAAIEHRKADRKRSTTREGQAA